MKFSAWVTKSVPYFNTNGQQGPFLREERITIKNKDFPDEESFIHDIERQGYHIWKNRVHHSDVFDYIEKNTSGRELFWTWDRDEFYNQIKRYVRWEIRLYDSEHVFETLEPGCGWKGCDDRDTDFPDSETIEIFDTREAGERALRKYKTYVTEFEGVSPYYRVEEYELELIEYDEDDEEWVSDGEYAESEWPETVTHNGYEYRWDKKTKSLKQIEEEDEDEDDGRNIHSRRAAT